MKVLLTFLLILGISHLTLAFYAPGSRIRQYVHMHTIGCILTFLFIRARRKIEAKQIRMASSEKEKLPEKYGPFFFDQPIDHFSLNTSTFKHRYWANTDHYKPGGPVVCKPPPNTYIHPLNDLNT